MPAANALCTLAQVREYLQRPATSTEQDDAITDLIDRASKMILNFTGREFAPATTSDTRTFVYEGNGQLDLAPYDLRSVTSLSIDVETTSPTALTAGTDFFFRPKPNPDGTYTWLTGLPARSADSEVSITGAWGFSSVPADVEDSCIKTVALWLRRDVSAFTTTFNIAEDRAERPESLPSAVRAALWHYRRARVY